MFTERGKGKDRPEQQSTTAAFSEVQKEVRYRFVSINQGFSPYAPLYSGQAMLEDNDTDRRRDDGTARLRQESGCAAPAALGVALPVPRAVPPLLVPPESAAGPADL